MAARPWAGGAALAALAGFAPVARGAPCMNALGLDQCFHYVALDATLHCAEWFCPGCPYAGYCDAYCGFCDGSMIVQDCRGVHAPSIFVGDGFCDSRIYLFDGKLVDFDCPEFECDGGDCVDGTDPHAHEGGCATAMDASVGELFDATIYAIQHRGDRGDDLARAFDCHRSALSHRIVRLRGVAVSLVAEDGFYAQEAPGGAWRGVFVHTGSRDPVLAALKIGDAVDVVGYVDEHLGRTQIETAGIAARNVTVVGHGGAPEPVDVSTEDLGDYARRPDGSTNCASVGEPYEGVLVRLRDVALRGEADDYGRVEADDGSGPTRLDSAPGFDAAASFAGVDIFVATPHKRKMRRALLSRGETAKKRRTPAKVRRRAPAAPRPVPVGHAPAALGGERLGRRGPRRGGVLCPRGYIRGDVAQM